MCQLLTDVSGSGDSHRRTLESHCYVVESRLLACSILYMRYQVFRWTQHHFSDNERQRQSRTQSDGKLLLEVPNEVCPYQDQLFMPLLSCLCFQQFSYCTRALFCADCCAEPCCGACVDKTGAANPYAMPDDTSVVCTVFSGQLRNITSGV